MASFQTTANTLECLIEEKGGVGGINRVWGGGGAGGVENSSKLNK